MSDRVLTWIALCMIVIVMGVLFYRYQVQETPVAQTPITTAPVVEKKVLANVKASVDRCSRHNDKFRLTGAIRNTGNVTLTMVLVKTEWRNKMGMAVYSREKFVVSPENPLAPGETREVHDTSDAVTAVSCHLIAVDWGA